MDVTSAARSAADWHPDGSLLAVPGTDNDVVCFERLSWDKAFTLGGEHSAPVNLVSFSPNGAPTASMHALGFPAESGQQSCTNCVCAKRTWLLLLHRYGAKVSSCAWRAGLYVVSGGRDKQLVVWDVPQKRALAHRACDAVPCQVRSSA